MSEKTRSYNELMKEFMAHWNAAAELAHVINAHPDNPRRERQARTVTVPNEFPAEIETPTPKSKPRKPRVSWPKELEC